MNKIDNLTWLLAIPKGWRPIFLDAVERLHAIDPGIRITQAKEKFGTLRIYLNGAGSDAYAIVDAATAASRKTCEICGPDGQIMRTADSYYSTRCLSHATNFSPVEQPPTISLRIVGFSEGDPELHRGDHSSPDEEWH